MHTARSAVRDIRPEIASDERPQETSPPSRTPGNASQAAKPGPDGPIITGTSVPGTLWGLVRDHRLTMGIGMALSLVSAAAAVAQPRILQSVVNGFVDRIQVWDAVGLLVAAVAVQTVATSVQSYVVAKGSEAVAYDLRRRLSARYLAMTIGEHDRLNTADLLSRAVSDAQLLKGLIATGVVPVVAAVAMLVAVVGVMVILNPALFAVTAGFVVVGALFVWLIGASARRSSTDVQNAVGAYGVAVERLLSGIRSVKAFSAEAGEQRNTEVYAAELRGAGVRLARVQALVQPVLNLCLYGCLLTVVVISAAMISSGDLDLGGFAAYLMYLFMLITPISSLGQAYAQVQVGFAAVARIREMDAMLQERTGTAAPAVSIDPDAPLISLQAVEFGYLPGVPVLNGIDLDIHRGEKLAVVGASGSGKSTLLDLLERFYEPRHGMIRFRGADYTVLDPRIYRRSLALVPQDCQIVTGTLRENLTMGLTGVSDARLHDVLSSLGLDELLGKDGFSLDSDLGQSGGLLSGGQRQRIAWARAMLTDAEVILLDEPTASLDAINEAATQRLLQDECADRTVITVTHRPSAARRADRVIVLNRGRIDAVGTHGELVQRSDLYRQLMEHEDATADA
jgi:ABC-type multidrug transport system fused ATPase/permease subunit